MTAYTPAMTSDARSGTWSRRGDSRSLPWCTRGMTAWDAVIGPGQIWASRWCRGLRQACACPRGPRMEPLPVCLSVFGHATAAVPVGGDGAVLPPLLPAVQDR